MSYIIQPITDRTWIGTKPKTGSQFNTSWSKTIAHLSKEIAHLGARDFVIQMDITAADLRLDGELRANARPMSDAVVVAFESKHGPLTYRCDRYSTYSYQGPAWQHNIRAIALTLERLRDVDRYGATETGQQYAGFKALGAGRAMPASHMTSDEALQILAKLNEIPVEHLNLDMLPTIWKHARRKAHPDRNNGDRALWDRVEAAAVVLGGCVVKPGSSEFGLVVGLVLFVLAVIIIVTLAGDPTNCDPAAVCGGAR